MKERAKRRLANEEAYENEFNQEGQGRKRQTFPLSTGRFAEDKEAVPLTRKEKSFRKEEDDEDLEVKERSMKLPESEIKRQKTKRQREKERKQRRAEEERAKEAEKKRKREEEAQEHEDEEKPKKDKKKKKKKKGKKDKDKEKEEERSKARGSAASARQSSSFNPSKGRMGGSTSEDEEKGELHRLEAPEKVPRSRMDLKVRIGQGSILLSTLVPVILHCQLEFCQDIRLERSEDTRSFPWQMVAKPGYKEVANGISVWTCHDWFIQCG